MRRSVTRAAASAAVLLTICASWSSAAPPQPKAGSRLRGVTPAAAPVYRLIVTPHQTKGGKLRAQLNSGQSGRLSELANHPLQVDRKLAGRAHLVRLEAPVSVDEANAIAARLKASGEIDSAEPDLMMTVDNVVPNDPAFSASPGQWHYQTPVAANLGGADMPPAWDITRGSGNITVAVLDTGFRPHRDLPSMLPGYDFISSVAVANDGNGRDADASDPGDFVAAGECARGSAAAASSWHGTHVMGTIAALMDNGLYGTGVAPNVRLLPVRVLGKCGGYTSDIVEGLRWAAGIDVPGVPRNLYPARVINLSLGSSGRCSAAFQSAINEVNAVGAMVIVASGNGALDAVNQPANCSGALAVTSHTVEGDNADYANIGVETLLSAPGGGCGTQNASCMPGVSASGPLVYSLGNTGLTTPQTDTYALKQGTSMAAPHVAGTIALMLSMDPQLTRAQVSSVLRASSRPHPSASACALAANAGLCGAGLLDAQAALTALGPVVQVAVPRQVVAPGVSVLLNGSAEPPAGTTIVRYAWREASSNPLPVVLLNADTPNASFVAPARGTFAFTLSVTDSSGATGTAVASVRINSVPQPVAMPAQSVAFGARLQLQLRATDADGDTPVFAAAALPAGATLSAAGLLTWPSAAPVGEHAIDWAVSDADGSSAPSTLVITVIDGGAINTAAPAGSGGGGSLGGDASLLGLALLALVRRARGGATSSSQMPHQR